MKKKFLVAYTYKLCGSLEVEAESLEQAEELACELSTDNVMNEFYVDDSFEIDNEFSHEIKE